MSAKRVEKRARRQGGYVTLHEEILSSPAYHDLSPLARVLFVELLRVFRPSRNGRISLSISNASRLLGVHKDRVSKAFHELEEHGFVKLTRGHLWQQRVAREWRITSEVCDGREPTDEWKTWQPPEKSRSQKLGHNCPEIPDREEDSGDKRKVNSALLDAVSL